MGQQQLLLLVLTTIIVAFGVLAGIQAYEEGFSRANADALIQRGVGIAIDIQTEAQTPSTLGGPGGVTDENFPGGYAPSLKSLGYDVDNNRTSTPDGDCFLLDGGSANSSFEADTTPSLSGDPPIVIGCESDDNAVAVGVSGVDREDITTAQVAL